MGSILGPILHDDPGHGICPRILRGPLLPLQDSPSCPLSGPYRFFRLYLARQGDGPGTRCSEGLHERDRMRYLCLPVTIGAAKRESEPEFAWREMPRTGGLALCDVAWLGQGGRDLS